MIKLGLSGNALKVIAIIAMTIDHLAWVGILQEKYVTYYSTLSMKYHQRDI